MSVPCRPALQKHALTAATSAFGAKWGGPCKNVPRLLDWLTLGRRAVAMQGQFMCRMPCAM
eukprot:4683919-Alexandrium_andersonii.AAC.1